MTLSPDYPKARELPLEANHKRLEGAYAAARECLDNEGHRATDALRDLLAARDQLQRDIDRMERLVEAVGDEYDEAAVQRIRAALQALHAAVVLGDLQRDVALVQEAVAEDLREESWEAWQRIRARLDKQQSCGCEGGE